MTIVFCSSEVVPFAKTGGLADVCGALPLALEKIGINVIIVMPLYKCISIEAHHIEKISDHVSTTIIGKNIPVYFISSDVYFKREGLYGDDKGDYPDNLERFQFFCLRALEVLKQLDIKVNIVHCHDWHAALIPVYLKFVLHKDVFYKGIKSVISIHNLAYQGVFPKEKFSQLGLDQKLYKRCGFEFYDQINFLKAGIVNSDVVMTVSQNYAKEIQTEQFGCGLDKVIQSRKEDLTGIVNGIDYHVWNPETDPLIENNYSAQDLKGKSANKSELQRKCSLPLMTQVPVFGFVGRLTHQKGMDLLVKALETLVQMELQVVFLGLGETEYHQILQDYARHHPEKISVHLQFDEKIAHQIYAGSDIFLMPSVFEPCGLSQMICLRYGTIPLVFRTGGLADTIVPFEKQGNGFVFQEKTIEAFIETVTQAINVFHDSRRFEALRQKAFTYNFSWEDSAKRYQALYQSLSG